MGDYGCTWIKLYGFLSSQIFSIEVAKDLVIIIIYFIYIYYVCLSYILRSHVDVRKILWIEAFKKILLLFRIPGSKRLQFFSVGEWKRVRCTQRGTHKDCRCVQASVQLTPMLEAASDYSRYHWIRTILLRDMQPTASPQRAQEAQRSWNYLWYFGQKLSLSKSLSASFREETNFCCKLVFSVVSFLTLCHPEAVFIESILLILCLSLTKGLRVHSKC